MLLRRIKVFVIIVLSVLLLAGILSKAVFYSNKSGKLCTPDHNTHQESGYASLPKREKVHQPDKLLKSEIIQKTQKLQMPFISNDGQVDNQVAFYAMTFGGTVFVTKEAKIVYSLPGNNPKSSNTGYMMHDSRNEFNAEHHVSCILYHKSAIPYCSYCLVTDINNHTKQNTTTKGWVLKEELVDGNIHQVKGEEPSVTKVSFFIGNNPSKHRNNIQTYNLVNLGEVYEGIDLKLRAYGNNVEKLFYVKPDADPEMIQIKLNGARELSVNEDGLLDVDTALGLVKFTKPVAYQEIDGKRVEVNAEYQIQNSGARGQNTETNLSCQKSEYQNSNSEIENIYGFKVATYDKTKELVIDPLLASTYLGGSKGEYNTVIAIDSDGNIYLSGDTNSPDFPVTIGAYDTSYKSDGNNIFISKLNTTLTSLLVSTYLGGTRRHTVRSLAIDSNENIYITGDTDSADFPTTEGAYDTSYNGGYYDVFVSRLSGDLTSLLASTYLGGSSSDYGTAVTLNSGGDIYVTGVTNSSDFPVIGGSYDPSYNGDDEAYISILSSDLTSLTASTFLGGGSRDEAYSIAIEADGSVYVYGYTLSSDFPTTTNASDNSFNGGGDAFVSKFNTDLTSLLSSTYLGGSVNDWGSSIAIDLGGNIFVTGNTYSSDFPTTIGAYDTSFNDISNADVFISKYNGTLTNLLASTYIGGSSNEYSPSIAIDPDGNIFVTGTTLSPDFPTTTNAYDTSYNGKQDIFVSKLNSDLTSLTASTYLGGSLIDWSDPQSIAIDPDGNINVTGRTDSPDFPITAGTYQTNLKLEDVFVSKLTKNLSGLQPIVTTGSATNVTSNSVVLNGTVNANGLTTTAWYEYGATSGLYSSASAPQIVIESNDTNVSISINDLLPETTYYYRIAAQNSTGTSYGSENNFTTIALPSPTPTPKPTVSPTPIPTPIDGNMCGQVTDAITGEGINGATVTINTGETTTTGTVGGQDGVYCFPPLAEGEYIFTAEAEGYIPESKNVLISTGTPPDLNFALMPTTGTLGGQVTDAVSGAPIMGAIVALNTGETDTTRANGAYVFQKIDVGDYIVSVSAEGYETASQIATIIAGQTTIANFALMPIAECLVGQVTDAVTGVGIVGATVTADGLTTTTTTGGAYCLQGLAEGDYIFTASADGYISQSQSATVVAGETTRVDFALVPITALTPTPTVTPAPSCEANSIEASPKTLKLKKEESGKVTITLTCFDGSPDIGETVTAKIKSGKKRITVSPQSAMTDVNGQAIFTITATQKTGKAKVKFESDGLTKTVTVNVKK